MAIESTIWLKIIEQLTKLALEIGWKQLGQKVDRQLQQQVGDAVKKYVQTYDEQHCQLKYDSPRASPSTC
jgi:hypothetical protein